MRLSRPLRRAGESVVPMINVAFLLLIFFLMVAVVAPPDPFQVDLPSGAGETGETSTVVILVGRDGQVVYNGIEGDTFLEAVDGKSVLLRADAALSGANLNALLKQLIDARAVSVQLAITDH